MADKTKKPEPVRIFGALAHPIRLGILRMLENDSAIVNDMVEAFGLDQTKISKHLAILRQAGFVSCSPEGRCRRYTLLDPDALAILLDTADAWPSVPEKP